MHLRVWSGIGLWALLALGGSAAEPAPGATRRVAVREAVLRDTASPLGRAVATLTNGQPVTVVSADKTYAKVALTNGQSGWLHQSAFASTRVTLSPGRTTAQVSASDDELASAGKGFNSDVEASYRRQHQEIDFRWIDRMVTNTVPEAEIRQFLKDGGLPAP